MFLASTHAEAMQRARTVHVNGSDYILAEYVGAAPVRGKYVEGNEKNDNGLPQGFLVHQPPGSVTPPHFHETNQFQVFVGGTGHMGKHPAAPLTVQYANGHTPYGPIVAGEKGVQYFTLRQRWDPGAKYMPASRDKLAKGNQRTRIKAGIAVLADAQRRALPAPSSEEIFAPETDGLEAKILRAGPDQEIAVGAAHGSGGAYVVVVGGSLALGDNLLGRLATLFVTPDEPAQAARSAQDGVELLVLTFPAI